MSSSLFTILIIVGIILLALLTIGLIFSRLYKRSSKEVAFVRTGLGGQKVILNGGAIVLPVLHEIIPVNLNTMRLEVRRSNDQALITRDRMRVDVLAEFYTRVKPTADAIASAAQTLGQRTMVPDALRDLVEGKFVDALRAVAAEMTMEELHERRVDFVQKVQVAVTEDLLKNGLELETVSLTGLDQTSKEYFNPDNAFDAAGLTRLTSEIEEKRQRRNEIEQDTQVAIEQKNLEADRQKLEIARDVEYARLQQEREISIRRASQMAEVASEQSAKEREAKQAEILAEQQVKTAEIEASRQIEEQRIEKERTIREQDISREKTVEIANQERSIAIAEKSREQSLAQAEASRARSEAVKAEELVATVRETEIAERQKSVDLVEARRQAEREAIAIQVAAEAKKLAAEDEAESINTLANAEASRVRITAEGAAEAEKLAAEAAEARYTVDAAGRLAINEADNVLSQEIVAMKVRLAAIEHLQGIVRESVKPMENIDGIKIIQVDGLTGGGGGHGGNGSGGAVNGGGGNLADQVVASALRYRSQAPLVDALMKEVGLSGADLAGLAAAARSEAQDQAPAAADDTAPALTEDATDYAPVGAGDFVADASAATPDQQAPAAKPIEPA